MDDLPHLAMSVNWRDWEKRVFLRAKGCCEYCGKDMMESSDMFYHFRNFDHIQPNGVNHDDNMAVACQACNNIKRHTVIIGNTRDERIAYAKKRIDEIRIRNDRRLAVDKDWFQKQLAAQGPTAQ